jgi:hypothetical protein
MGAPRAKTMSWCLLSISYWHPRLFSVSWFAVRRYRCESSWLRVRQPLFVVVAQLSRLRNESTSIQAPNIGECGSYCRFCMVTWPRRTTDGQAKSSLGDRGQWPPGQRRECSVVVLTRSHESLMGDVGKNVATVIIAAKKSYFVAPYGELQHVLLRQWACRQCALATKTAEGVVFKYLPPDPGGGVLGARVLRCFTARNLK